MSKRITKSKEMVATKNKNNVLSCSTPEHRSDSPSRDSDSICDSEAASPVPFLCTQDGAEGLTEVVWNFYTPKSENAAMSRQNSSPISRRAKRARPKLIEKQVPKRRPLKATQKRTQLFQELIELNENLHELIAKKTQNITDKPQLVSEDDLFSDSPEHSPKGTIRSKNCLRKNVLSSNFTKPDPDTALDSDDSMNECLIKASQVVEEKMYEPTSLKRPRFDSNAKNKFIKSDISFKIDQDSMDAILNSIRLESPIINHAKKCGSPQLNNDSFDSLLGNLNDSALDRLTQMPAKTDKSMDISKLNTLKDTTNWTVNEITVHDGSPSSKSFFGRYNSMPESPSISNNKPSTSGMVFGRYSSMPHENNDDDEHNTEPSDSPIRCTPDEIKKKHQLAREKLMAKRLLPFTLSQKSIVPSSSQSSNSQQTMLLNKDQEIVPKVIPETGNKKFQPRVPSTFVNVQLCQKPTDETDLEQKSNNSDIKSIIEKKRQEALMRLRRRQVNNKII